MAESLSKPVQELIVSGGELPEKYIHKKGEHAATDVSYPPIEVPVIDLSLLASQSAAGEEELGKLRSALGSCGCFQAINHGMTASFLDQVHEIGKQFFALPIDEKQKYARTIGDMEGYGTDSVLSEHQTLDWTDRLYITVYPEDKIKLRFWPENPENFRSTFHISLYKAKMNDDKSAKLFASHFSAPFSFLFFQVSLGGDLVDDELSYKAWEILNEYTRNLSLMNEFLLKSMAKSLNIEEDCFLKQYGEGATMIARFNFYPPCPRPDLTLGVKPHADGSTITFLLQDKEVEGLQIFLDGQWFRVPIVPHAILINVGDQAEIMSNGMFKSPVHRVVTNSERERLTLAVFCLPDAKMEIGPVEELVDEKRPRLYKTMKDYVAIYFENYQLNKRPIDAVKI
ncbi:hypothetical protein RHSIM_Rhsim01G0055600 [Rhododendron simsii]|uniref:Fe2OG dioxygenase domain-containing protein n=1 Tax=Rhododendron simsii TaxID=118357 RepID=A0A834HHJ5_RHOSS|nr:hypothetical protein RHSIM_Rhsim01G0055600 [Rhododendron simsii]